MMENMLEILDPQSSNKKLKEYCNELRKKFSLNNRLLLVNSPQFNINNFEIKVAKNKGYYAYPPTGLQYLADSLRERNLEVDILDINYELLRKANQEQKFNHLKWMDILKEHVENKDYSIIGISNLFYVDAPYFFDMSNFLRGRNKHIIIAGGQNATYNAEDFLKRELCDFICQRESENKINFLLDNIFGFDNSKPIPGILFKYKGKIERTEGIKDVVELKGNLIREHELLDIENYCKAGSLSPYSRMIGIDLPFAGILLNRGCRGRCKFCDVRDYTGGGVRTRVQKDFLDEIEYLSKKRGVKFFEFLDDDFTRYKNKSIEILQGIIDRDLGIKWASNNGLIASTIDEELMEKMRDSGCVGFKIGVESGNPEILKGIEKPGTLGTFKRFSQIAQKFPEMFIVDNYIIGLPDETFKEMRDSYEFSLEMNLDWSSFALYQQNASLYGLARDMRNIKDFTPTKNIVRRVLGKLEEELEGPEIFNIPKDSIPSLNQKNQIWFTFNLTRNFILNKNLRDDGNPEKFISWTRAVEERYPTHPYVNFFIALANNLTENFEESKSQYKKMQKNLEDPEWIRKFKQFSMYEFVSNFPINYADSMDVLKLLGEKNGTQR